MWLAVCVLLFGSTVRTLRRGFLKVSSASALTATLATCLLLLPVISVSDDLLQARQGHLPLAAQTWHLASEAASTGLEATIFPDICLLALLWLSLVVIVQIEPERDVRRTSGWLTRSQRLRPPPFFAL